MVGAVMGKNYRQLSLEERYTITRLRAEGESIYRFIYMQYARTKYKSLRLLLPCAKFKRGFRGRKGGGSTSFIKHRVSIDKRPKHINKRKEFGH